jgi:hypothetical protein
MGRTSFYKHIHWLVFCSWHAVPARCLHFAKLIADLHYRSDSTNVFRNMVRRDVVNLDHLAPLTVPQFAFTFATVRRRKQRIRHAVVSITPDAFSSCVVIIGIGISVRRVQSFSHWTSLKSRIYPSIAILYGPVYMVTKWRHFETSPWLYARTVLHVHVVLPITVCAYLER